MHYSELISDTMKKVDIMMKNHPDASTEMNIRRKEVESVCDNITKQLGIIEDFNKKLTAWLENQNAS
tara:strand:- start:548 stop:748 length:201 start_codon:yes stop_codon:yes gene_type:complete